MRLKRAIAAALIALVLAPSLALAAAGVVDRQLAQFPPPDFVQQHLAIPLSGDWTASVAKAVTFVPPDNMFVSAVHAIVRAMSGTITAFTVDLRKNDISCLKQAINMYQGNLAGVGAFYDGTLLKPVTVLYADSPVTVDIVLTGSDTPTASSITLVIDYHSPVGLEEQ